MHFILHYRRTSRSSERNRATPSLRKMVQLMPAIPRRRVALIATLAGAALLALGCTDASKGGGPTAFAAFADTYFDSVYAFAPSAGTAAGFHQYDSKIVEAQLAAEQRRIATLKLQLAKLDTLRGGKLSLDDSIDAALVDGAIRSELQDLEVIRSWQTNPMGYAGLAGGAVDLLMKRNFAPPVDRLKAVTARLRGIPAVLAAMKANISNPPKEFTDISIDIAGGSVGFFKGDVAKWAKESAGADTAAMKAFTAVNDSVIAALTSATEWLKKDLKPRSKGSYAIGAKAFADKLMYDEMVDIPLDQLLARGEANLQKDYDDFVATAKIVAPGKTPLEAMASLESDHPTAANLIESARSTVEGARQFLIDKKIVDVPSEVRPIVMETPPYARNGSFASMDSPGAYETKATEAFYYVTPPEKDWDAKHIEEHLKSFNGAEMPITTAHETFPGHYLQFLYVHQFPTKTRKLLASGSNVEGWAHYTEIGRASCRERV